MEYIGSESLGLPEPTSTPIMMLGSADRIGDVKDSTVELVTSGEAGMVALLTGASGITDCVEATVDDIVDNSVDGATFDAIVDSVNVAAEDFESTD